MGDKWELWPVGTVTTASARLQQGGSRGRLGKSLCLPSALPPNLQPHIALRVYLLSLLFKPCHLVFFHFRPGHSVSSSSPVVFILRGKVAGTHYEVHAGLEAEVDLELASLLPQPPAYQEYRRAEPHLVS